MRVSAKVAGCTAAAVAGTSSVVGWNFQALLRKSKMTGVANVTAAPMRTGLVVER